MGELKISSLTKGGQLYLEEGPQNTALIALSDRPKMEIFRILTSPQRDFGIDMTCFSTPASFFLSQKFLSLRSQKFYPLRKMHFDRTRSSKCLPILPSFEVWVLTTVGTNYCRTCASVSVRFLVFVCVQNPSIVPHSTAPSFHSVVNSNCRYSYVRSISVVPRLK